MNNKIKEWRKLVAADLWDNQGHARVGTCDACQEALQQACDQIEAFETRLKAAETVCEVAAAWVKMKIHNNPAHPVHLAVSTWRMLVQEHS